MTARIGKVRIASHESPYTVVAPMTAVVATVVGSMSEAPAMRPEPDDLRRSSGRNDGAFFCSPCPGPAVGPLTAMSVSKKCCCQAVAKWRAGFRVSLVRTPAPPRSRREEVGSLARACARFAPNFGRGAGHQGWAFCRERQHRLKSGGFAVSDAALRVRQT